MKNLTVATLFLFLAAMFCMAVPSPGSQAKTPSRGLEWKMVWLWSMSDRSDAEIVNDARLLGFNAIQARSSKMVQECHSQGLQAFGLIAFAGPPSEFRQSIPAEEQKKLVQNGSSLPSDYQYGGEPIRKGEILLDDDLWCFDRPEALQYGKKEIDKLISDGYDGIAFDYIGFKNYHSCNCPVSLALQDEYCISHPNLARSKAIDRYSLESLVSFYNSLIEYARARKPGIVLTAHIYPYFAPDPLYGDRIPVDYCGQTVSWFFKPHWSLGKVRKYARVVSGSTDTRRKSIGIPFIGIYSQSPYSQHRKTPERVREEIRIIKASGSKGIQIAELGHILKDPGIAEVVKEELASGTSASCIGH